MKKKIRSVIFDACLTGADGRRCEVVISEDWKVHWASGGGWEGVRRHRRESDQFLWDVQQLGITDWERRYGEGSPSEPGGWAVILEIDRRLHKWEGCGEYPPRWDEFCALVREFAGRPFGD